MNETDVMAVWLDQHGIPRAYAVGPASDRDAVIQAASEEATAYMSSGRLDVSLVRRVVCSVRDWQWHQDARLYGVPCPVPGCELPHE